MIYTICTKNKDRDGKVFYLTQTKCFSVDEAKKWIKKKGSRKREYIIHDSENNILYNCPKHCFACKSIQQ